MVGRIQREEALQYVRGVIARAVEAGVRSMAEVLEQEDFTRQDVELLRHYLLPDARWAAQDAYATMRQWEQDPAGYARAFAIIAATILAVDRAQRK